MRPDDRYRRLDDQADVGLGAEEFEDCRRFTRLSEKSSAPAVAAAEAEKKSNPNPK